MTAVQFMLRRFNYLNMDSRILAIHDLSGFGNTSLMAIIPLMYRFGLEVCALPTSILSSNTCFKGYRIVETDSFMRECLEHWKALGLEFGAIYSGFLGNPQQVNIVLDSISSFATKDTLVLIDPVMADEGKLYSCYNFTMVEAMRKLIAKADLITPNFTEACFLADLKQDDIKTDTDREVLFARLHKLGVKEIIITSVPSNKGEYRILYSSAPNSEIISHDCQYIPCFYTGTGDIFSALMLIYTLKGIKRPQAINMAADFISRAISYSESNNRDGRAGILLQQVLSELDL